MVKRAGKSGKGNAGELHQIGGDQLTTNHGMPISGNQNSLKAGSLASFPGTQPGEFRQVSVSRLSGRVCRRRARQDE